MRQIHRPQQAYSDRLSLTSPLSQQARSEHAFVNTLLEALSENAKIQIEAAGRPAKVLLART